MFNKIGFIGAGTIAEILIKGIIARGSVAGPLIMASDVREERLSFLREASGIQVTGDNLDVVSFADVVFLAVKPVTIGDVLREIAGKLRPGQIVVSVAAGIGLDFVKGVLGEDARVVRIMPNTPCLVGEGVIALARGTVGTDEEIQPLVNLLSTLGRVVQVDEGLMNCVTGLSGSGPAFVYTVIEALADGGVRMGLSRDVALAMAAQTVAGAGKMVLETGEHPARLRDMVTSPGGTTIAGLHALEGGGLRAALINAVVAATDRAKELGSKGVVKLA